MLDRCVMERSLEMEQSEHQRIQTKTLVCEKEGMMEKLGSCNGLCKQCVDDDL